MLHTHTCTVPRSDATTPVGAGGLGVCRPESGSTRTDVSLAVWLPTGLIDQYADSLSLSSLLSSLSFSPFPRSSSLFYSLSSLSVSPLLLFPIFQCSTSHFSSFSFDLPSQLTTNPSIQPPILLSKPPNVLFSLSLTVHHSLYPLLHHSIIPSYSCTHKCTRERENI